MPSPDLVDIAALLAPIPGDQPAGSVIPFEIRQQLEEGRKEEDPDSFAPDDPMRPQKFKKADWRHIVQLARDTLARTSKDLLVAARLTEALVKEHGLPARLTGSTTPSSAPASRPPSARCHFSWARGILTPCFIVTNLRTTRIASRGPTSIRPSGLPQRSNWLRWTKT
jgi:hypothetical protein